MPTTPGLSRRLLGFPFDKPDRDGGGGGVLANGEIAFNINGGIALFATGLYVGYSRIAFPCTITDVTLMADGPSATVIDIWAAPFDPNNLPALGNSICGGNLPTLAGTLGYQDTVLTGWTKAIPVNTALVFNVNSNSLARQISIVLGIIK